MITSTRNQISYLIVTLAYWVFMLSDGALRMLVLLHFHLNGFSPLQLAYLFLFYELAGIVTNVSAGWLAAKYGLKFTLYSGLSIQIIALYLLSQLDENFSIIVNQGPGSFSGTRISLAVAKGLEISKKIKLFGYKSTDLEVFNQENIEKLIRENLIEKKLIKPIYLS